MKKLKGILIIIAGIFMALMIYVLALNPNTRTMTIRQKILKAVYPAIMWATGGKKTDILHNVHAKPLVSFYSLETRLNNGELLNFASLKGKKVLLVNTASDCGYTNQYEALQKLYEANKDRLMVIGFPANDFKEQEKGNDEEIAQFCRLNFGVTFPLAAKTSVIKNEGQNPVFSWLSDSSKNGWNDKEPTWNFSKYLVNEKGELCNYFAPAVDPLSQEVTEALSKK